MTPIPDQTAVADLVSELENMAHVSAHDPAPIAQGTFAMYAMEDGGLMVALDADSLGGVRHQRIPPGLIRAIATLANGGSKFAALKAMTGRDRPKALDAKG